MTYQEAVEEHDALKRELDLILKMTPSEFIRSGRTLEKNSPSLILSRIFELAKVIDGDKSIKHVERS